MTEERTIPLTIDSDGKKVTTHLSISDAEALGLQMIMKANGLRPEYTRILQEQPKFIVSSEPETELRFERDDDGRESIAVIYKPNGLQPIWVWYNQETAVKLAHSILTMVGGASSTPTRDRQN